MLYCMDLTELIYILSLILEKSKYIFVLNNFNSETVVKEIR